jgi:RNA polymerase sigma factor (sigma-70 family)
MTVVAADADPDAGDADGDFAGWVGPSLLPMTRLARRLAPDAEPDDVVQDALVRAWQKWHLYDAGRGTPTTWLLAIVADQARAARRSQVRRLAVVDHSADVPDASAPHADGDGRLDEAIAQLPDRQALAIQLHYFVGLSVAETAAVMSCAPGTVKSTLFDARTRLRQLLGAGDD